MGIVTKKKAERESGIELLRILTMFGVIILHYCNKNMGGALLYVEVGSFNETLLFYLESLCICAVDTFVLISGFFLVLSQKRKIVRPLELIIQVIVFRAIIYIGKTIIGRHPFSIKALVNLMIPNNYFVILYVVLFLLSPYINVVLHKVRIKCLLILMLVLFSIWPFAVDLMQELTGHEWMGLSTIGLYGSQYGYSIVNFVLMYVIGGAIRLLHIEGKTDPLVLTVIIIADAGLLSLIARAVPRSAWEYCDPLVIIMAVCLFLIFKNLHFHSKLVNSFAKAAFTCFLTHEAFLGVLKIDEFVKKPFYIMLLHIFISVVLIYFVSVGVHFVYSLCTTALFQKVDQLFTKKNLNLSVQFSEKEVKS